MMTNAQERRNQPRAGLGSPAVAFVSDQRVDCRAIDISVGGIGLLTPMLREPGQFLRVNFSLAPPGGIPRWYDADGVIVRVARASQGVVLGVQFVVVDDRVARDVHAFVSMMGQGQAAARPAMPMPDGHNPPSRTGEFSPPGHRTGEYAVSATSAPEQPRRRTATYGAAPDPAPAIAAPRRATPLPIPRTSVVVPVAVRPVAEAESKADLERLFRAAVSEVDGQRAGARKDRRSK